jgi:PAS domain S-box-containing protein
MSGRELLESGENRTIPVLSLTRPERPRQTALLIAGAYLAVAVLWIWGSDRAVRALSLPQELAQQIEVWKGTAWVVMTAAVLYLLIARPLVRLTRARARALEAKSEAQARATELETVLDAVPVAVWIARDPECRVIEGNRVGRELLGQEERVNLSMSAPSGERPAGFRVMVGGRAAEAEELPVQVAAKTGREVRGFEEELVWEDGRRVALLGSAVPLKDAKGRVTGAVGAFLDVTQREQALRALHHYQLILEQAQELGQIGSWVSDPAHHDGTLEWSRETYRIFGLREGEFDGSVETFFGLVHPDDRERVRRASQDAIEGKSEYAIDHRIVRRDGAVRWVHERARIERDATGQPLRMIGVCQDITERVEAERTLRASEARLRTALDAARMIGWESETGTGITTYSQDPVGFFGLDPATGRLAPTGALDIIHPDARDEVLRKFNETMAGDGESVESIFRSASPDAERWFRAIARIMRDPAGRALRVIGVTQEITEQRAAAARLRSSEARYRMIVETCQEGVWLVDKEWKTTFVNQRMAEMLGREPREILGRGVLEFMSEEEQARTRAHMREREAGIAAQHEYRFVRPDGREIWALAATNAIMEEANGFSGALAMFTDITERRRMEQSVRESEARFRELFESLPDPAWDWDVAADTTRHSATWPTLLGHAAGAQEEEIGTWESLLHPEDREEALGRLRRCVEGGPDGYEAEYRLRSRDGSYRWVLSRGRVVERGADGRARRMIGAITDMTERRRAEDDLRISEARFRTLIESAPEAIVVLDVETRQYVDCNQQAGKLVGLTIEELLKSSPVQMSPEFQPDGRRSKDAAEEYIRRAVAGESPQFEWTHLSSDGREIPCEIRLGRLPHRERVLVRGSIMDITERKRSQEALRASEERLRIFIESAPAGVAMLDRDLRYIAYSKRWLRDYSLGEQDLKGRRHYDVFPEIDAKWREVHARCLATGLPERCEEDRFVRQDGAVEYLRWEIQPWRDSTGAVGGLVFFTEMITERKMAEDALRASEEKYRLVLRATSDAMWDYEPTTGLLRWGDNVESMFGYSIADMGDRLEGWSDRLHPEDLPRALGSFHKAIDQGESRWIEEYRFRRADGTYAVVLDRAYMLRNQAGEVVRIIGAMSDITERRLNEQLMSGQARTLEKLVGGEPLRGVLEEIVRIVEEVESGCLASVLLLDKDGVHVRTAAAPSLPEGYSRSIDGVAIGPEVGSCGTAMHRGERVIVTDIATDPLWAGAKDLALVHGLLAMYYKEVRGPGEHELRTISWAARLAGLAIERRRAEEQLRKRENDLRDLLNAVPDLMFRMDREGRYLEYHAPNPSELATPPEQFMGRTVREALPPERAEQCMSAIQQVLATGVTQSYEYQVTNQLGLRYWEVRVTRCTEEQVLLLVRNITVRRTAERKLRENEQRLSLLVRQSPLGVIVWDLEFRVAEWNAAAEHIFGWGADDALGKSAEFILPESVRPQVAGVWEALKENRGGTRSTNANVTQDGRTIYCEWYNAPLINADGRVFAIASIVDDVTEERMAQQRQQLMMAELDHRVKNNLAAVISLAEQSGRTTTTFADFRESFLGRVRALSRLHNALAATRWHGANLGTMVRQTLEAFGQDATSQAVVEGPGVVLPARAAQAMGMALNELCTNAIKYGALSVPGGRIEVRWALRPSEGESGAPTLELSWAERGGPKVVQPTRRGFGTELIEGAISYELGGSATLRFAPDGLVCHIRIEMPADAEFDEREVKPGSLNDQVG